MTAIFDCLASGPASDEPGLGAVPSIAARSPQVPDIVSVVIVSWNGRAYLEHCLQSLVDHAGDREVDLIVVDNASSDGSPDMVADRFPEVTLIRCDRNLGFSRANNIGFAHARGHYIALINSDVIVHPHCLDTLTDFLAAQPSVGMVGPRIVGSDGQLQLTCRRLPNLWNTWCRLVALDRVFPHLAWLSGFEMPALRHGAQRDVPALGGCFWVVRRETLSQVGLLDERFFFYAEDMDWCKRCVEYGWRIVFQPAATATHHGGGSSGNAPIRYSVEIVRSTLMYWKKHHGQVAAWACFTMLLAHHAIRLGLRGVKWLAGFGGSSLLHKMTEDLVCLRWLLTGREVASRNESSG